MTKKKTKKINFDLSKIAGGGAQEKFDQEMKKVIENILDVNTAPKKKRKVAVNLTFEPSEKRDVIETTVEVKSTLAPQMGISTSMMVGRGNDGYIEANELKSGVPGQTYIDPEDSQVKTDTGEPVEEVEQKSKIVDLQKQKKAGNN